jgi:hypothetical protein
VFDPSLLQRWGLNLNLGRRESHVIRLHASCFVVIPKKFKWKLPCLVVISKINLNYNRIQMLSRIRIERETTQTGVLQEFKIISSLLGAKEGLESCGMNSYVKLPRGSKFYLWVVRVLCLVWVGGKEGRIEYFSSWEDLIRYLTWEKYSWSLCTKTCNCGFD